MLTQSEFGFYSNGQAVTQYTLTNQQGMQIAILDLGAIIRSIKLPIGPVMRDVALGFDTLVEYEADQSHFGAIAGRFANRIGHGQFTLDGQEYQLSTNLGGHCLHGGVSGFNRYIYRVTNSHDGPEPSITLAITSEDGDQGFPGKLAFSVRYTLTQHNALHIEYRGCSTAKTVFNPTQHSYFNLAGHDSGSIGQHQLQLNASQYTPTDDGGIPSGEIVPVAATPLDFTQSKPIAQALSALPAGLDHNLCVDDYVANSCSADNTPLAFVASVSCEAVSMDVHSSMPGVQIFTANHIAGTRGKGGCVYQAQQGLCIETQFYPDAPNHEHFPSATLAAEQEFVAVTQYTFHVNSD